VDTLVVLWALGGGERLSPRARAVLNDPGSGLVFSAASAWEMATKAAAGRLRVLDGPPGVLERLVAGGFEELPIGWDHAVRSAELPLIHTDPFDRLLVAQAQLEGIPILTSDRAIHRYDVETIW
jgi:PIN domain nuclease of toxin-antitoxin system